MPKAHWSLSPIVNILLIPLWAIVGGLFVFLLDVPAKFALPAAGAVLGIIGGIMQHLAVAQASAAFGGAPSLLEVRRCLNSTPWGRRYIFFLYLSKAVLVALALLIIRGPLLRLFFGYVAGYFSLMFTREIITLRDTFRLHDIAANERPNGPTQA
jgi:hypothetical protein